MILEFGHKWSIILIIYVVISAGIIVTISFITIHELGHVAINNENNVTTVRVCILGYDPEIEAVGWVIYNGSIEDKHDEYNKAWSIFGVGELMK